MDPAKQNSGGYTVPDLNGKSSPAQTTAPADTAHINTSSTVNNGVQHAQSTQQQQGTQGIEAGNDQPLLKVQRLQIGNQEYAFLSTGDYRLKVEGWRKSLSGDAPDQNAGPTFVQFHEGEFDVKIDSASDAGSDEGSEETVKMDYTITWRRDVVNENGSRNSSDSDPEEHV